MVEMIDVPITNSNETLLNDIIILYIAINTIINTNNIRS